jgi:transmembrane protein
MRGANLSSSRPCAVAKIATQLVGSFPLITNVGGLTWVGAVVLGVFTSLCIPWGDPFWRFKEPERSAQLYVALEHVVLMSDLLLAAIASRAPSSFV